MKKRQDLSEHGKKGGPLILVDTAPQSLIRLCHAKKYSSYYTQYMPSCHTARKQPPGRILGGVNRVPNSKKPKFRRYACGGCVPGEFFAFHSLLFTV